ncbi:hypothetical protein SERLADRAFT_469276 [Serpula lacrymans var. lacrymans S7.9]|uniref:Uncharacterized protein n=1 Tax=Serpula lacrymans var. lacrymans (strain S7.9) TaxID=578457 RepID=F8NZX4_SERL9|nr:uncharacterized protein SERLADRAFT_469276 [Serpula lacrymans var. lacrymans S7.9]EGO23401.1 hypothetical protein SERLADRAFT_469276 [Serpula lacrymans var. lacrymans S7.9]
MSPTHCPGTSKRKKLGGFRQEQYSQSQALPHYAPLVVSLSFRNSSSVVIPT